MRAVLEKIKSFHVMTLTGVALLLLFLFLCNIDKLAIRWWLMLPLAFAGGMVLYQQWKISLGLERKVCLYGLYVLTAVFLLRDVRMAQRLATMYDRYAEAPHKAKVGAKQLGRDIGDFFKSDK